MSIVRPSTFNQVSEITKEIFLNRKYHGFISYFLKNSFYAHLKQIVASQSSIQSNVVVLINHQILIEQNPLIILFQKKKFGLGSVQ